MSLSVMLNAAACTFDSLKRTRFSENDCVKSLHAMLLATQYTLLMYSDVYGA